MPHQRVFAEHPVRREVFLIDQAGESNAALVAAAVTDAVDSIDACGRGPTRSSCTATAAAAVAGFVLKAWAMRAYACDERHARVAGLQVVRSSVTSFVELLANDWPR